MKDPNEALGEAWEALAYEWLNGEDDTSDLHGLIERHRPGIEAAARASAGAGLDEALLRQALSAWWGGDINERVPVAGRYVVALDLPVVAAFIAAEYNRLRAALEATGEGSGTK